MEAGTRVRRNWQTGTPSRSEYNLDRELLFPFLLNLETSRRLFSRLGIFRLFKKLLPLHAYRQLEGLSAWRSLRGAVSLHPGLDAELPAGLLFLREIAHQTFALP
jgi:hypothetical protein